jgi:type IV pilus assembly protein PilC
MPEFEYLVKDQEGHDVTGVKEATDLNTLVGRLREEGYLIIKIQEAKKKESIFKREFGKKKQRRKRIKIDDLVVFTRQMATLINAGIPLVQSLDLLNDQIENPSLKTIVGQVKKEIEEGKGLSESLLPHKKVFSQLFISMVRAGESSGNLDGILDRLAAYLEKTSNLQKKIRSAMIYPIAVSVIAFLITALMLTFIIPQFAEIFSQLEAPLPTPTKVLIAISDFFKRNFFWIMGAMGLIIYLSRRWIRTDKGKLWWDGFKLRFPIFGILFLKSAISKFSRTLSTLIKSGVPILTALDIVSTTSGNRKIELAVDGVKDSIREGDTIAAPLSQKPLFPTMVVRMIAVGEETGELDTMLGKIADFYEAEVDAAVDGLSSLLEPIIIAVLGVIIGGIVICMFLPIFSMTQAIR